jgi:integrase
VRPNPVQWWDDLKMPKRLRERLRAKFTIVRDGYMVWYRGKTRFAAGRKTTPEQVFDTWEDKRKTIDAELEGKAPSAKKGKISYREVLSLFMDAAEHRVSTGLPRPLSKRMLHNYTVTLNDFGNFVFEGKKVADMTITGANSPDVLAAFARTKGKWKASGYDSIISRVGALFRWAVEMDKLDRYRPGPGFQRPPKSVRQDQRIALIKSYTPEQIARMYLAGNQTMKCFVGLGISAAMNNSEVAHLERPETDLAEGVIDFRRRKTGKVRRVIPLPADVLADLKAYVRPDPIDPADADAFFLTRRGHRYSTTRRRDGKPSDLISRLWYELEKTAEVPHVEGRSFSGLRTTFFNLAPGGEYEIERKVIMGRAHGTIDLDHYLETLHLVRLRHVVDSVWNQIAAAISSERGRSASGGSPGASPAPETPNPARPSAD